ncbi:Fic family protein [Candidatus Pseudothioglobus sp. Uisw_016]|uniref:Fic family protein n=1 Tax=Candidatus Pseudothioglobus sp. Uisw_016 TaxID=3230995 RepID=UPI003A886BF9
MFGFLKKEQLPETPEITQSADWTKDIKRSKKIGEEVEQLSFLYSPESNNEDKGTKKGLSRDHLQILKKCKLENSALELMKILKRSNKSKFKTAIINPLLDQNFLELTIPDSPKSPSQKYRLTGKFVKKRIKE